MISKQIGLKIKFERIKRNWTQEELGFRAELNKGTIWKIETNRVSPNVDTLEKIANALEMTFIELVDTSKVEL